MSARNDCTYCHTSHGAIAAEYLGGDEALVAQVKSDPEAAAVSPKLKALLAIAGKVAESGKSVRTEHVERARREGATDKEIHDTVLIAAAFCMFNRYVDGLDAGGPPVLSGAGRGHRMRRILGSREPAGRGLGVLAPRSLS